MEDERGRAEGYTAALWVQEASEVEPLREALAQYGQHMPGCASREGPIYGCSSQSCDCGWSSWHDGAYDDVEAE